MPYIPTKKIPHANLINGMVIYRYGTPMLVSDVKSFTEYDRQVVSYIGTVINDGSLRGTPYDGARYSAYSHMSATINSH